MCETCGCTLKPHKAQAIKTGSLLQPADELRHHHDQNQQSKSQQHQNQKRQSELSSSHDVLQNIMDANDSMARDNRLLLNKHGVFTLNLMSSPGAGKTRLLEATIKRLKKNMTIAVIEGDLETENDANRIRSQGVTAVQITTGSACHLDAHYIHDALLQLPLKDIDLLFIENVGNLVCPAAFDLGQDANIALLSTTEGDDKPLKYPVMFQKIDGLVISKLELLEFFDDFAVRAAESNLRKLANHSPVWPLSAKTGEGLEVWLDWLTESCRKKIATQNNHVSSENSETKLLEKRA